MSDPDQLSSELLSRIAAAADLRALEEERVVALGRHGSVTALLKTLGSMTAEERQERDPRP